MTRKEVAVKGYTKITFLFSRKMTLQYHGQYDFAQCFVEVTKIDLILLTMRALNEQLHIQYLSMYIILELNFM